MHARLVNIQLRPGTLDEGVSIFWNSVVPAARQQKGWKDVLLLLDREGNKITTIGLWETEEDMIASVTNGYLREQLAKVVELAAAPPVVYEVSQS